MELTTAIDDNWGTPYDLFHFAEFMFGEFNLDAAAEPDWKMCENYIGEEQNALDPNVEWKGDNIWINPPYDIKNITAFIKRSFAESANHKSITLLLPVKSDQQWFHDLVEQGAIFIFIRKRVKFRRRNGLPAIGASFPVMLVRINSTICEPKIFSYDEHIKLFEQAKELKMRRLQETISEEIDREILKELIDNLPKDFKEGIFNTYPDRSELILLLFANQQRILNELST